MANALGMQQTLNEGAMISADIVKQGAWLGAGSRRSGQVRRGQGQGRCEAPGAGVGWLTGTYAQRSLQMLL